MKKAIIFAALISTVTVLGACRERHVPMKMGTMAPVAAQAVK